jgi:hypothetical protein
MLRFGSEGLRRAGVLLASIWIGACATDSSLAPATTANRAELPAGVISTAAAEHSQERIAIGKSTKADVAAALGAAAATVSFESGFEVWVYRIAPERASGQSGRELVLLFAPSGMLAKTRLRPPGARGS